MKAEHSQLIPRMHTKTSEFLAHTIIICIFHITDLSYQIDF